MRKSCTTLLVKQSSQRWMGLPPTTVWNLIRNHNYSLLSTHHLTDTVFSVVKTSGLKVVGEVKKVGKSRNFHPKVGKSRNFSVLKVGKSRKFIHVFITSLHTGTSIMLVSFIDFKANHLFSKNVHSTPN